MSEKDIEKPTQTLKEQLSALNISIHEIEDTQVVARNAIAAGEKRFADEKILLLNNIAMEKTDDGKPKYSNETKRQAAFQELMVTGHPLHTLEAQLNADRTNTQYSYNKLQFLKRQFQILLLIRGENDGQA